MSRDTFRPSSPLGALRPTGAFADLGIPPVPESGWASLMPGLWVLKHYRREFLAKDLVAGLVVTSVLVPAGMGYAVASGLPAITGLYATILPLLAYAVFGPSRILVLGPDSGLVALVAAVVATSAGDEARAVALGSMLGLLVGLISIAGGLLEAGFLTELLSKPVRVGYMNGIALTVLVGQLPKLFGFSVHATGIADGITGFFAGVSSGELQPIALAIGGACLVGIVGLRALAPRFPGVLLVVVVSTVVVTAFGLESTVKVVGPVPRGIPLPSWPSVGLADVRDMFVAAVGVALVAFADTSVLSRTFAARHGYRVDPNRELVALGIANLAGGFFQGFPVSSSSSRTPVAESAGAKTQLTGVVGALAIALVLAVAPWLMQNLPTAALAAVVLSAALRLFDWRSLRVFHFVRRSDFWLSLVAFSSVATLGVINGIAVAVGVSILDFVRRAWRPHEAILGRAYGVKGYHDIRRYPDARQIPGLVLFRWDAPLFFANADLFRDHVLAAVEDAAEPTRWVVIAAEPITDVDTTAAEMIQELDYELGTRGVDLVFAEMKDPVKDRLNRYGLKKKIGHEHFFPTLGNAVKTYQKTFDVEWQDWEDEAEAPAEADGSQSPPSP